METEGVGARARAYMGPRAALVGWPSQILRSLVSAVSFMHEEAGVVHRDLKPEVSAGPQRIGRASARRAGF